MKKILWIGDGVTPTGFSTVNHNIIMNLSEEEYEVHHIAVNYFGDPHPYKHYVYPAVTPQSLQMGDVYGFNRLKDLIGNIRPDLIFILNDIWVIRKYLEVIKDLKLEVMPKVVVYFPVDGEGYYDGWFSDFDIVSKVVVYTEFGKKEVLKTVPELEEKILVLPHGTNTEVFYPVEDKHLLRKQVFSQIPELWEKDSFVVLNVNRNQPRKMLDLSLRAFAKFAAKKPVGVRYYHHAGLKDTGWDMLRLVRQIDEDFLRAGLLDGNDIRLENRFMVTNLEQNVQRVSLKELNNIYNSADVGINTSLGEGWGLTSTEGAATKMAQIVPNHTACTELFEDCGLLTDVKLFVNDAQTLLKRGYIDSDHLAEQLELLYNDRDLLDDYATKAYEKFSSEKYQWSTIAKDWEKIFNTVLGE